MAELTLTLAKLRKIMGKLRKVSIKPYKGYFRLSSEGLYEIKNEQEYQRLKNRS